MPQKFPHASWTIAKGVATCPRVSVVILDVALRDQAGVALQQHDAEYDDQARGMSQIVMTRCSGIRVFPQSRRVHDRTSRP